MHARSHRRLALAALLLLGPAGLLGCAGAGAGAGGPNIVMGTITPAHFRFKTVNRKGKGREPAGWRAVCINAVMNNGNTKDTTLCNFEVGVPLRSRSEGEIALQWAQERCAYWANAAAHQVMKQAAPDDMTAVLCIRFKTAYQELLRQDIEAAVVSACQTEGLETVTFNPFPLDFLSPIP